MKKKILLLAAVTLIGFPFLAICLNYFISDTRIILLEPSDWNIYLQILLGLIFGYISAFFCVTLIRTEYMKPVLNKYLPLIKSFQLNVYEIVFISFCAGFGEEVFFRGFLQNYFGVIATAFIFVALHGYLDPRNLKISIYGILMLLIITLIGYMKVYVGLIGCIAAHTMIDIYLFYFLTFKIDFNE